MRTETAYVQNYPHHWFDIHAPNCHCHLTFRPCLSFSLSLCLFPFFEVSEPSVSVFKPLLHVFVVVASNPPRRSLLDAAALTRESLWNSNQDISNMAGGRAKWTQSQRSGPRDGPWNELELENHQGDIPRLAANFTIVINLSFESDIMGPTIFADTLTVPRFFVVQKIRERIRNMWGLNCWWCKKMKMEVPCFTLIWS